MGRLQKIRDVINAKLPSSNSAFVKVRGLAIPLDVFLGGRVRFAKKIGALLPVWLPDNAAELTLDASPQQNKLTIDEPISWIVPGSKLRLANQIFAFVDDVVDDGYAILVRDNLPVNFYIGDSVELFAHPIEVNGDYSDASPVNPKFVIYVYSDHKIYLGDEINVGSFNHEVTAAHLDGTIEDGRYHYQLTLKSGITSPLYVGRQDQAYLRAYPAYESNKLKVPTVPGKLVGNIGPFLYDRVSGPFFTDMNVDEIDVITAYDSTGSILFQKRAQKNDLMYAIQIPPDMFLFWDKIRGEMQWSKSSFVGIPDAKGLSHIHYKCVPTITPGQIQYWRLRVTPDADTTMVVELEPSGKQTFELPGGRTSSVTIQMPNVPIERIHVMFRSTPGSKVYMKAWEVDSSAITSISHATVVKLSGRYVWGSSVAFAKPYWLRLDYLRARIGESGRDRGLIAL